MDVKGKMNVKEILMESGAVNAENYKVFEEIFGHNTLRVLPVNVAEDIVRTIKALIEENVGSGSRDDAYIAKQSARLIDAASEIDCIADWGKISSQIEGMEGIDSTGAKIDFLVYYFMYVYKYHCFKKFFASLSKFQEYLPDEKAKDISAAKEYINDFLDTVEKELSSCNA